MTTGKERSKLIDNFTDSPLINCNVCPCFKPQLCNKKVAVVDNGAHILRIETSNSEIYGDSVLIANNPWVRTQINPQSNPSRSGKRISYRTVVSSLLILIV